MDRRFITTRKIDELGRIVLPAEALHIVNVEKTAALDVSVDGNTIILTEHTPNCIICKANDKELKKCKERMVCIDCIAELSK